MDSWDTLHSWDTLDSWYTQESWDTQNSWDTLGSWDLLDSWDMLDSWDTLDSWDILWDMSISVQLVAVTSRHADQRCSGSVGVLWNRLVVLLFTRRIAYGSWITLSHTGDEQSAVSG